jgi:hypothetical protein
MPALLFGGAPAARQKDFSERWLQQFAATIYCGKPVFSLKGPGTDLDSLFLR